MFEYRISKYDPALRDSNDAYTRVEWTMASQVGQSFNGVVFTAEECKRVENAYVAAALAFLRESGITSLKIEGLENPHSKSKWTDGSVLELDKIAEVVRSMLQEEYWCRLESEVAFVHIGWDYYMYVGVPHACHAARASAEQQGLFVEEIRSPYHQEDPG